MADTPSRILFGRASRKNLDQLNQLAVNSTVILPSLDIDVVSCPTSHTKRTTTKGIRFKLPYPLERAVAEVTISMKPAKTRVRGLVNRDNKCFLNVVLQSLMMCSPFHNMLASLERAHIPEAEFPALSRIVALRSEFAPPRIAAASSGPWKTLPPANTPVYPTKIYELLKRFNPISTEWQEDSQEFLCFLLDMMHDELAKVSTKRQKPGVPSASLYDSSEEWEEVGKKNKTAIVLTVRIHNLLHLAHAFPNRGDIVQERSVFKESLITDIFGGEMRSVVRKKGLKSSASLEPFFCIHLDVLDDSVRSVEDALSLYMHSEKLESYTSNNTEVIAYKQHTIDKLPRVLVLHLKRFDFGLFGSEKVTKPVEFSSVLKIKPQWLTYEKQYTPAQRTYSLYAVISHIGNSAIGGHYTCDIRQPDGSWMHYDDATVTPTTLKDVLQKQAYLLLYTVEADDMA